LHRAACFILHRMACEAAADNTNSVKPLQTKR